MCVITGELWKMAVGEAENISSRARPKSWGSVSNTVYRDQQEEASNRLQR